MVNRLRHMRVIPTLGLFFLAWFSFSIHAWAELDCSPEIPSDAIFAWTPPTTGSPVVKYRFYYTPMEDCDAAYQLFHDHPDLNYVETVSSESRMPISSLDLVPGIYNFAVAGVDAQHRVGILSNFTRPDKCACYTVPTENIPSLVIPDPTDLVAQTLSQNRVRLAWQAPAGIDEDYRFLVNVEAIPASPHIPHAPPSSPLPDPASCYGPESITLGRETTYEFSGLSAGTSYYFRVCTRTEDGISVGALTTTKTMEASRQALHIFPNPFHAKTTISYSLSYPGKVSVRIYTVAGNLVRSLFEGSQRAGAQTLIWNGRDNQDQSVASGTYLVRIQTEEGFGSQKVLLVK